MHESTEQPEEEPGPTGPSPEGGDSNAIDDISAWVSRICQNFDLPGQKAASEPVEDEDDEPEEVIAEEPVELEETPEPEAVLPLEVAEEAEKVEPEKVEPEKVEPEKVEPEKVEPEKVEPEKVEPEKVEPAKVEPEVVLELLTGEEQPEEQTALQDLGPGEETGSEQLAEQARVSEPEISGSTESQESHLDSESEEDAELLDESRLQASVEDESSEQADEPQEDDSSGQVRVIKLDPSLTMVLERPKEPESYQGEALSLQLGPQAVPTLESQEEESGGPVGADTLLLGIPVEPEEVFELTSDQGSWMPVEEPPVLSEESIDESPEPESSAPPALLTTAATMNLGDLPPTLASPAEKAAVDVILPEPVLPLKPEGRRQEKLSPSYPIKNIAESKQIFLDSESLKADTKPEKRPGGNLRSLEQALVQPIPRQLPPGIENRAIAAVGFLSTLESTQRAMVIIVNERGEMQVVAAGGMGEDSLTQTSMRLLRSVLSTNTPLLLLDCTKDARFGKDAVIVEQQIRSVVCVPFRDCVSRARGLLYADNISKPSAFSYRDLGRTEDFARSLATEQHLGDFEHVVSASSKPEESVEVDRAPILVPWIFVAAISLILFMILPALSWSSSKTSKPKTAQTPLVVKHETADSEAVVVAYLRALESGNFANAYLFLSPRIRAQMSQVDFQNKAQAFLEKDNNAWEMSKATVIAESVDKETQRSYSIRPLRKDGIKWTWNLKKERDLWYLDSFKGGLEF